MMDPAKYFNENYTSKAVLGVVQNWIEKKTLEKILNGLKEGSETLNNASWVVGLCKSLYFTFIYEGYKVDDYAEAVYLLSYETTINSARSQLRSKFDNGTATNGDIERYQQLFDLEIIAQVAALHAFAGLLSVYNRYDLKMKAEDQAALLSWNHDYNWYIGQCKKCLEADLSAGKAVKRANNNQAQPANSNVAVSNNTVGSTSKQSTISAASIVSEANALVGKYPYVWGGRSPADGGFDCTGLVYYIYHTRLGYGMTVEQSVSKSKLLAMGTKITNKADLLPGDIIQYTISHVGIYIGNNTVIHSGSSKGVVKIPLNVNGLTFSYGIRLPNIVQDNKTNSGGNQSTSSTPSDNKPNAEKITATYRDCDVEIACVNGQTVNLYSNPGDTSRVTYFSKGQTVRSIYCATLSDGSTWYRVNADYNGDYRTFWLKHEPDKMTVTTIIRTHTIHFNANGGSVSISSKQVKAGETYGELPTPTRSGYIFDGWYTASSGGTQITSSTTVNLSSDQITLYAHWTENVPSYIVKSGSWGVTVPRNYMMFLYNDANSTSSYSSYTTSGPYDTQGFLCNQQAILSDGTIRFATGFFEGGVLVTNWFTLTDVMSVEDYESLPTYTVTLNANGGSVSPSAITVRQGRTYDELPQPTRTGYTFDGWYTAAAGGTQVKATYGLSVNADHTLYAHWTENGLIASGTHDSVSWKLDTNGTLIITGTGSVGPYFVGNGSPLEEYADKIRRIIINEGITSIFNGCRYMPNLVSVELPLSLTSISISSFIDCPSLKTIIIPQNVSEISATLSFSGCSSLTSIQVSGQNSWYSSTPSG